MQEIIVLAPNRKIFLWCGRMFDFCRRMNAKICQPFDFPGSSAPWLIVDARCVSPVEGGVSSPRYPCSEHGPVWGVRAIPRAIVAMESAHQKKHGALSLPRAPGALRMPCQPAHAPAPECAQPAMQPTTVVSPTRLHIRHPAAVDGS